MSIIKHLIRERLPVWLLNSISQLKLKWIHKKNESKSTEDIFTEIYKKNTWGGEKGEFCSGAGTVTDNIASSYISTLSEQSIIEGFRNLNFVDLGCGDFQIGKQLLPLCSRYIGVDIVEPLIANHNEKYGDSKTKFMHLNIAKDELPDGDVCFIRQVFQHISNIQISAVLAKLKKYKWVFITEHNPMDDDVTEFNIDKVSGQDIRGFHNSGIFLWEPPFNIPKKQISKVLEVVAEEVRKGSISGVITTYLYKPFG